MTPLLLKIVGAILESPSGHFKNMACVKLLVMQACIYKQPGPRILTQLVETNNCSVIQPIPIVSFN